ncbi:unnamed protein product [Dibothriocephalus latus]|uniref:Rho-GAP domain-containing protein n=1 Tax=Dibothriocephalus latus TaxID=60516 RepID=A0A3P7LXA0_DIBLA|nr:unnamed protein product [Dibothriocephalus latus]
MSTPLRSPAPHKTSLNCARPSQVTSSIGNGAPTGNALDEDRSQKALIRTAKATQLNAIKQDLEVEAQLMKASSELGGEFSLRHFIQLNDSYNMSCLLKTKYAYVLSAFSSLEKALHELYNFESMSILECGKALVDLVEISASYHRTCVAILEELSPMLKEELGKFGAPVAYLTLVCFECQQCEIICHDEQCPLPVFGRQLETHLQATGRRIAYPIKVCVRALNKPRVLAEESALNTLRAESIIDQYDSFVIADVLKQYLRRLPEPLLTRKLFAEWTAIQHM